MVFLIIDVDELMIVIENKDEDGEESFDEDEFSVWNEFRFYLFFMKVIYKFGFKELTLI